VVIAPALFCKNDKLLAIVILIFQIIHCIYQ